MIIIVLETLWFGLDIMLYVLTGYMEDRLRINLYTIGLFCSILILYYSPLYELV